MASGEAGDQHFASVALDSIQPLKALLGSLFAALTLVPVAVTVTSDESCLAADCPLRASEGG